MPVRRQQTILFHDYVMLMCECDANLNLYLHNVLDSFAAKPEHVLFVCVMVFWLYIGGGSWGCCTIMGERLVMSCVFCWRNVQFTYVFDWRFCCEENVWRNAAILYNGRYNKNCRVCYRVLIRLCFVPRYLKGLKNSINQTFFSSNKSIAGHSKYGQLIGFVFMFVQQFRVNF